MVTTLITENQMDVRTQNNEENERRRLRSCGKLLNTISAVVLHVLDTLFLMILLPFMIWQWISASDRLKIILRAIVEVTLELIMWVIFAGVSILMTATFVVEDIYFRKSDENKLRELLNESTRDDGSIVNSKETRVSEIPSRLKEIDTQNGLLDDRKP